MKTAKCQQCGKKLVENDTVFQLKMVQPDGSIVWGVCCSENCAEEKRAQLIGLHLARAHDMKHQQFQKAHLSSF